jgi:hypothetical protein
MARRSLAILGLAALTGAAPAVHGYHFGIEDQTLYIPAILNHLDPTLFPHDSAFFLTEARWTLYDEMAAAFLRITRLRLDWTMFLAHLGAVLVTLAAGRTLLVRCFDDRRAEWSGLALLVLLLPFPVAGTRMGLMEQYFHPRAAAMACALLAFVAAIDQRRAAFAWLGAASLFHPLTGLWSAMHVAAQLQWRRWRPLLFAVPIAMASCSRIAHPPPTDEAGYWRVALSAEVFRLRYPPHWPWYEWAGVLVPLIALSYWTVVGRRDERLPLARVSGRLLASASAGVILAVVLTLFPDRRWPLQPMRELHLVYIVVVLFAGARVEQLFLGGSRWKHASFFATVTVSVMLAQRQFPASPHIEWPGRLPANDWVAAFDWARQHTTRNALFALDPFYMSRPGTDSHSFRVFAQRSMLAEAVHDLAPAAMSAPLAERWMQEVRDTGGWTRFVHSDFTRLHETYGIEWTVVEAARHMDLTCPYVNTSAAVCKVD